MTFSFSRARTVSVRACVLGLFLSAPLATAQVTFTAADTGETSFRWEESGSWVERAVPNAAGAEVTINKFTGLDRNVNLGNEGNTSGFTVGKIFSTINADGRNRIRRGSLSFQASSGNAEVRLDGSGEGRLEFRMDESSNQVVHLASTLATWVEKENEESELRFRGNLSGPGGLILNGIGEVRLRVSDLQVNMNGLQPYTYAGPTVINQGVLRLRQADLINTASITVHPGGQLRLDARQGGDGEGPSMNVSYALGNGTLTLSGMGRDAANPLLGGVSGALRQHGQGTPSDIATVSNPIVFAADAAVHSASSVDVGGSVLNLNGPLSGPGMLIKTGGGHLNLTGANTSGGLQVDNGTVTLLSANALANAPLRFSSRNSVRRLTTFGNHIVTRLEGTAPDPSLNEANTLVLQLAEGSTFTVNQEISYENGEESSFTFQGDITGRADFVKSGSGMLRFTRFEKTYSGRTIIDEGVLEVSQSAVLENSSEIIVEDGGQLRLGSRGNPATYAFGGPLRLRSLGRGGDVEDSASQGVRGALRYDPGAGQETARLDTAVVLEADAGVHVNGQDKTLEIAGPVSGGGGLIRSGGGVLILSGANAFTGGTVIDNGITRVRAGSSIGSGVLDFEGALNDATLDLANEVQVVAGLTGGTASTTVSIAPNSTLVVNRALDGAAHRFYGRLTGGGHLRKEGAGVTELEGAITGLQQIQVQQGRLSLLNGAASVGTITIDAGAEAVLSGTFNDTSFSPDGTWIINHTGATTTFFNTDEISVRGEMRMLGSGSGSNTPAVQITGNLNFESGAVVSVDGGLAPEATFRIVSADSISGWESVDFVPPLGFAGTLSLEGNTLVAHVYADGIDFDELEASMGPVTFEGSGWVKAEWLGFFYVGRTFDLNTRWILPVGQAWWWVSAGDANGTPWIYDFGAGWIWTGEGLFPYVYSFEEESWLAYAESQDVYRWFYRFAEPADWIQVPYTK